MRDGLVIGFLSVLPRRRVSRLMGWAARRRLPRWLLRAFLRWYVPHYGVNLDEAAGTLDDYETIVAFFTRRLKDGVRPVCADAGAVVSPCDGLVNAIGRIEQGRLPQAADLDYAVADLLGGDERYEGGDFAVIYLSPKDYHRVHSPVDGRVIAYRYRPGRLWPVFAAATRRIRDLFARNERLVARVATASQGEVAVVMVGAFGVGRMAVEFADLITNTGAPAADVDLAEPFAVARAGELGRFEMGSTVVLVFEPGQVEWEAKPGDVVRLGERIGGAV